MKQWHNSAAGHSMTSDRDVGGVATHRNGSVIGGLFCFDLFLFELRGINGQLF